MAKPLYVEPALFVAAASLLGAGSLLALHLHAGATMDNAHRAYAIGHLAPALLAGAIGCTVVAFGYGWILPRAKALEERSTMFFVGWVTVFFCIFWLPVLLAGGFVQDDWMLLAAASVRQSIVMHPAASWMALDSVDGNFRPLGTVLYISWLYHAFGLVPRVFLLGNFLLNLGGVLVAFLLVRELGYTKRAAAAAAMLYLSRGVLYTQMGWVSALGDCIVDLLTAMVVLLLLKAIRRPSAHAVALHFAAWGLFAVSTLAKQSSSTTPLVVAALLWLRPGSAARLASKQRLLQVAAALAIYGGTVALVLFHAKSLLGKQTPYPLGLSLFAALRSFAYFFWYFETLYVPADRLLARTHPALVLDLAGMSLVAVVAFLLLRYPRLMGERPRDLAFLLVAGLCSISPFLLSANRNEAYYGTMLAFWISLGLAIMLTRIRAPGPRRAAMFGFWALMALGFIDIRLKQIGAVWPGGYFWGNADVDAERTSFSELREILSASPHARTVVLIDPPIQPRFYASMVVLLAPQVERIFIYDEKAGIYLANDRGGQRPSDGMEMLRDVGAYKWLTPVDVATSAAFKKPDVLWIRYTMKGFIEDRKAFATRHVSACQMLKPTLRNGNSRGSVSSGTNIDRSFSMVKLLNKQEVTSF